MYVGFGWPGLDQREAPARVVKTKSVESGVQVWLRLDRPELRFSPAPATPARGSLGNPTNLKFVSAEAGHAANGRDHPIGRCPPAGCEPNHSLACCVIKREQAIGILANSAAADEKR